MKLHMSSIDYFMCCIAPFTHGRFPSAIGCLAVVDPDGRFGFLKQGGTDDTPAEFGVVGESDAKVSDSRTEPITIEQCSQNSPGNNEDHLGFWSPREPFSRGDGGESYKEECSGLYSDFATFENQPC